MVRHECYDEYGNKECEFDLEVDTCQPLIIECDGKYYQAKHYLLHTNPNIAKCIPVTVMRCEGGKLVQDEQGRESA